jgi:hypothetical protein
MDGLIFAGLPEWGTLRCLISLRSLLALPVKTRGERLADFASTLAKEGKKHYDIDSSLTKCHGKNVN